MNFWLSVNIIFKFIYYIVSMKIILTLLLLCPLIIFGQDVSVTKEYNFSNGYTLSKGGSIEIGSPSGTNGFKYIKGIKKSTQVKSGDNIIIKSIIKKKKLYEDDQISIKGKVNDDKCYVYFYPAYENGELVVPEEYKKGFKTSTF